MILGKTQNFIYYAGIMLDAIAILFCSKSCWHNCLKPNQFAVAIVSLSKESYILIALVHSVV